MNTQIIEFNAMKDKTQFVSNVAISALSTVMVTVGIALSVVLTAILLPFMLLNLYLIKRRFSHMMQPGSSTFERGNIIEGEYVVSDKKDT